VKKQNRATAKRSAVQVDGIDMRIWTRLEYLASEANETPSETISRLIEKEHQSLFGQPKKGERP
jgi:macrodomain Ter protein organizer (MatP/YcbG family)